MRVSIPSDWSGVSLTQFAEIYDLIQDKDLDTLDGHVRILSILTKLSVEQIEDLTLTSIKQLIQKIDFTNSLDMGPVVQSFTHKGYTWKVNKDITQLTGGDYVTLAELTKDSENIIWNTNKILVLFCKPHRKKWFKLREVEIPFIEKADLLKDVGVNIAYPLAVFFCNLLSNYILITEGSLNQTLEEMKKMIEDELSQLKNSGDGSQS